VRLDEAKIEELRRWGQTLANADSEGSVAAGRAILMLIEELDRLRLELWRAREQLDLTHHDVDPVTGDQVGAALQRRLQGVLGPDSDQSLATRPLAEDASTTVEGGSEATSAHSWIEALRRRR
jgi:hypothetical protein